MKRPPILERDFQRSVIELARLRGWIVYHAHDSRRSIGAGVLVGDTDAAGFPDLVLVCGERLIFAELKGEKGRLRDSQRDWLDALARTRAETYVWRPADWAAIVSVLEMKAVVKQ